MKRSKILSVLLPNYNHGKLLRERIHSILNQLPQEGELILVDDASTDESRDILKNMEKIDPRLKVLLNKVNQGPNRSVMRAFSISSGEYICMLSADDLLASRFFEKTLTLLAKNPTTPFCCSDCGYFFDQYKMRDQPILMTFQILQRKEPLICSAEESLVYFRDYNFWIPGHTVIIRREYFERGGGINEKFGPKSDWFLFHSIALDHGFAYIPETLGYWRAVSSSYTSLLGDQEQWKKWKGEVMSVLNQSPELLQKFNSSLLLERRF